MDLRAHCGQSKHGLLWPLSQKTGENPEKQGRVLPCPEVLSTGFFNKINNLRDFRSFVPKGGGFLSYLSQSCIMYMLFFFFFFFFRDIKDSISASKQLRLGRTMAKVGEGPGGLEQLSKNPISTRFYYKNQRKRPPDARASPIILVFFLEDEGRSVNILTVVGIA